MTDVQFIPLTLKRAIDLAPLRNDLETQTHLRNPGLVGGLTQERWWNWVIDHRYEVRMFAVERDTGLNPELGGEYELIGCAGLTTIDWQNRRAELSVYTVPPTYEIEAAHLILRHAFDDLGLHKVEAETLTNRRLVLCEELGFSCEGSRRHAYWRVGKFIDSMRWGLLTEDWKG